MNHRTLILWLLGWTISSSASAQALDTLRLPEIRISDADLSTRHVQAFTAKPGDTDVSVAALISRSGGSVRSYAPGILETVSFRGFTASQTQVLWNGFPLNHAMVGLTDLSLYPAFLFDGMAVDKAGGSSDNALSAMGGTVELRSEDDAPHTVSVSAGAFGTMGFGMKTGADIGSNKVRLGIYRHRTENDYPYQDVFAAPVSTRRRMNADREQTSVLAHAQRIGIRYRTDHHLFTTHRESGIPGPISAPSTNASQTDRILRYHSLTAFRLGTGWATLALNGTHLDLDYIDTGVNSLSTVRAVGVRAGYGTSDARVFLERTLSWVDFSEYAAPDRVLWTLQGDMRKGRVAVSLRTDHDSAYGWFWSASAGARHGDWKAHASKTVGIPTFNDLYWPVLGDPDLVPESALKTELTWTHRFGAVQAAVPVFASSVRNGIQWIPGNDGRFRPANIRHVRSVGIEPELSMGGTRIHATYTDARYAASRFPGDQAKGRQVAYIPSWTGGAEHTARWKSLRVSPEVRYTGRRATTEDGRFPIDPQWVADVTAGAEHQVGRIRIDASATIRNLTNTDVSTIRWYPMPGRHLTFTITVSIL